jgi:hypothetical protein
VDRHRQLDHAEVGAEVAADRRTGGDQAVADLAREGLELVVGQPVQVARPRDRVEHSHGQGVYGLGLI